jgi:hypothetical protein
MNWQRCGRHQQHPVDQLVLHPVLGKRIEVREGELARLQCLHVLHTASSSVTRPACCNSPIRRGSYPHPNKRDECRRPASGLVDPAGHPSVGFLPGGELLVAEQFDNNLPGRTELIALLNG